jgi:hypothetical protein
VKTIAGAAATGTDALYTAELSSEELLIPELGKILRRNIIRVCLFHFEYIQTTGANNSNVLASNVFSSLSFP